MLYPLGSKIYEQVNNANKANKFKQEVITKVEKESLELEKKVTEDKINNGEFNTDTVDFIQASKNSSSNEASKNPLAFITIPKINMKEEIFNSIEERVLQDAIGILPNTNLPYGGIGTNSVLVGHRGTYTSELFRRLDEIVEGDQIFIENKLNDKVLGYRVTKIEIVLPDQGDKIKLIPDKDIITLVTCTPYLINSHRILITAERDMSLETTKEDPKLETKVDALQVFTIEYKIGLGILLIGVSIFILVKRKKEEKTDENSI